MKFKIHHNGNNYPVNITKKNGQFTIVLTQFFGDRAFPSPFSICRCTQDIACRLKHYKERKREIFEVHDRRFKTCS